MPGQQQVAHHKPPSGLRAHTTELTQGHPNLCIPGAHTQPQNPPKGWDTAQLPSSPTPHPAHSRLSQTPPSTPQKGHPTENPPGDAHTAAGQPSGARDGADTRPLTFLHRPPAAARRGAALLPQGRRRRRLPARLSSAPRPAALSHTPARGSAPAPGSSPLPAFLPPPPLWGKGRRNRGGEAKGGGRRAAAADRDMAAPGPGCRGKGRPPRLRRRRAGGWGASRALVLEHNLFL